MRKLLLILSVLFSLNATSQELYNIEFMFNDSIDWEKTSGTIFSYGYKIIFDVDVKGIFVNDITKPVYYLTNDSLPTKKINGALIFYGRDDIIPAILITIDYYYNKTFIIQYINMDKTINVFGFNGCHMCKIQ